ncbi:hypothetical protein AVEN_117109-1 [Araneus ventricosus]|uniref:Uncharacterized protein n=1 Tax=Araneus ventricosus TaxID=182803 RepID=A0A4Y2LL67_ARAVE|nr:hypothetical protein AVEN_117109-1 [Araneus ventricosus]
MFCIIKRPMQLLYSPCRLCLSSESSVFDIHPTIRLITTTLPLVVTTIGFVQKALEAFIEIDAALFQLPLKVKTTGNEARVRPISVHPVSNDSAI